MASIFLYPGQPTPTSIQLSDPAQLAGGGTNGSASVTGMAGVFALHSASETGTAVMTATGTFGTFAVHPTSAQGAGRATITGVLGSFALHAAAETGTAAASISPISAALTLRTASARGAGNISAVREASVATLGAVTPEAAASNAPAPIAAVSLLRSANPQGAANILSSGIPVTASAGTASASGTTDPNAAAAVTGVAALSAIRAAAGAADATTDASGLSVVADVGDAAAGVSAGPGIVATPRLSEGARIVMIPDISAPKPHLPFVVRLAAHVSELSQATARASVTRRLDGVFQMASAVATARPWVARGMASVLKGSPALRIEAKARVEEVEAVGMLCGVEP